MTTEIITTTSLSSSTAAITTTTKVPSPSFSLEYKIKYNLL